MSKRPRYEFSGDIFTPPKKRYPFRPCLSDGVTEEIIENFCRDQLLIQESLDLLSNNELYVFKTSSITDKILCDISNRIPHASRLERLVLVQGTLSEKGINTLCNSLLKSRHIRYIDLRDNNLSIECINMLISVLPFSCINTLNIGNNNIDLSPFCNIINKCSSITHLTLDGNIISNSKDLFLNILTQYPSLQYLSLVDCNLEGSDIENLIEPIKMHPSLIYLHLSCNPIRLKGIKAICTIIETSIALHEIHIIGVNYTEEESQLIVNSLVSRINTNLRLFPNILSRRAHYLRRIYPGKEELLRFLKLHNIDNHKELFLRFEITVESLITNKYLLSSLEKYQLTPQEIYIIQKAIDIACDINIKNGEKKHKYIKEQIFQHLLVSDIDLLYNNTNNTNKSLYINDNNYYIKGIWFNEQNVLLRYFDDLDNSILYQLQAAGNRLFRLRHPYILDFLGMFFPEDEYSTLSNSTLGDSYLYMVFEDITHISLLEWLYSKEGIHMIKSLNNTESFLIGICIKISLAMDYLSSQQKIVYSELLLSRIGLNINGKGEYIPKLWDFGLDCFINNNNYNKSRWYPPEGNRAKYSDIWMFGIVIWELFSYVEHILNTNDDIIKYQPILPFYEIDNDNDLLSAQFSGVKLNNPGCSNKVYQLICECTNPTPTKRPQFNSIYTRLVRHLQLLQPKINNASISSLQNQIQNELAIAYAENSDFMGD